MERGWGEAYDQPVVRETRLASSAHQAPKAFLRWVGGKRNLVHRLLRHLPEDIAAKTYHEPFMGAGSMFFAIGPKRAFLSDLNAHLVECYREIRDRPSSVARYLNVHATKNSASYYYGVREEYNRGRSGPAQAARFLYLNRTCFNGVFRVNTKGEFNVPYGNKPSPIFPTRVELAALSDVLSDKVLEAKDYKAAFAETNRGDFVYLDPPYPPLNDTAFFTHYTADRFSKENQQELAAAVKELDRAGVLFLMSNADLPEIRKLYKPYNITSLSVTRYVSCKGSRHRVDELVITNYSTKKLRFPAGK